MKSNQFDEIKFSTIESTIKDNTPLIVTATLIETKALHEVLKPIEGYSKIIKITKNNATYYVGNLGNFVVTHVQCMSMGSTNPDGSIVTISNAINLLQPKFVIMVGISFGSDEEKQKIGDVLVSEMLIPYELQRVGKDKIIFRGAKPIASLSLKNVFKNVHDWTYQYQLPNQKHVKVQAKLIFGDVLTGEKLVDNPKFKKQLIKNFPTAIGGEMEGTGLYAACQDKDVHWILIKSICDFGYDKSDDPYKDEHQQIAATIAVDLCLHVFNQKYVFEGFDLTIESQLQNKNKKEYKDSHNTEGGQTINNNAPVNGIININTMTGNISLDRSDKNDNLKKKIF